MAKPILVVTSRYTKEIEERIDRDFNARRNPNQFPFSQQQLLAAADVKLLVGASGFEPETSCAQGRRLKPGKDAPTPSNVQQQTSVPVTISGLLGRLGQTAWVRISSWVSQ
jgi:hypothetical protein